MENNSNKSTDLRQQPPDSVALVSPVDNTSFFFFRGGCSPVTLQQMA